jgi:hypothetical protein
VTAIDRTAYPRFKKVVPARELAEAFTPAVAEVTWAREKTQHDQHLLALVVWLKSYQRLGYFPKLDEVPAVVVEHVRGLLELSDEVTAEYDVGRTAKWHRGLVRALVGVKYDAGKARVIAEEAIRRAVTTKDNPADLINVALEELVRARRELPGFSTLDRLVAAIRAETNTALYAMIAARIDLAAKAPADAAVVAGPDIGAQRVRPAEDAGEGCDPGQVQAAPGPPAGARRARRDRAVARRHPGHEDRAFRR